MSEQKQEKSLIDMAREHMEQVGADPNQGVDVPEGPAASRQEVHKPIHKDPQDAPAKKADKDAFDGTLADAVTDLLQNVEVNNDWRTLELPSRGKAYVQSDGYVQIKPFTFAQERKLRSIKRAAQGEKVIASLIQDCVKGLEYESMTLEDKNYVLFKLREISYGNEYTIVAICNDCETKNNLTVEIDAVPVKYAPDDYEEPISITLPDSKQEVKFVTPRCKDEHYFTSMDVLTENLWRFVLSVGEYSDQKIMKAFFERTTVRDVAFFRTKLTDDYYGMNKSMSFECASCGEENESLIPFTESFFSVS
jgi:hypothetical protein